MLRPLDSSSVTQHGNATTTRKPPSARFSAVTVPPNPYGLPTAITQSPTLAVSLSAHSTCGSGAGATPGASGMVESSGTLIGGDPLTNGIDTVKTIANYYAYATTVFDYIRRAMPYNAPRSLADNEVYALTAYILSLNKLIGENDPMDAKTLPQVKMPNRDNWIMPYPDRI